MKVSCFPAGKGYLLFLEEKYEQNKTTGINCNVYCDRRHPAAGFPRDP